MFVAEHCLVQNPVAVDCFGVRVDEELVRIVAMAFFWIPFAVYAKAVASAWFDAGNKAVPHTAGFVWKPPASF